MSASAHCPPKQASALTTTKPEFNLAHEAIVARRPLGVPTLSSHTSAVLISSTLVILIASSFDDREIPALAKL
jgi:hypothetical protein